MHAAKNLAAAGLASLLLLSLPAAKAQEEKNEINPSMLRFETRPLANADIHSVMEDSAKGAGLRMWSYSVKSTRSGSAGQSFTGVMVGRSPITTNGTTTTTVYVQPIIAKIGGVTFDPTVPDKACYGGVIPLDGLKLSPMVLPVHNFVLNGIDVGTTIYSDAFQRANFWKDVTANGGTYHNLLNFKYLPAIVVKPGTANSHLYSTPSLCTPVYGGISNKWLGSLIEGTIIPSLASQGVKPTNLPIFMLYNTVMYGKKPSDCCIGGYHGAFGSPVQTYSPFTYDTAGGLGVNAEDTAIMSHEINEWQDDPLGNNLVPAWGHVGQTGGCQGNLEVGDPLTGTDLPIVKVLLPYHLQELAFFSWFFGPKSIGAGGVFSDNRTFTSAQGACN
jgi:hypothetical protein